jgi:hypothetical protein
MPLSWAETERGKLYKCCVSIPWKYVVDHDSASSSYEHRRDWEQESDALGSHSTTRKHEPNPQPGVVTGTTYDFEPRTFGVGGTALLQAFLGNNQGRFEWSAANLTQIKKKE